MCIHLAQKEKKKSSIDGALMYVYVCVLKFVGSICSESFWPERIIDCLPIQACVGLYTGVNPGGMGVYIPSLLRERGGLYKYTPTFQGKTNVELITYW